MTDKDEEADQIKFLMELSKHQGAACNPTTDGGYIIVLQRSFLQNMLDKHIGQEQFVILLKKPNKSERKGD